MPRLSSQDLIDIKRGVQEVSLEDGTVVLPACGGDTCSEDTTYQKKWVVSTFFTDPLNFPRDIVQDDQGNFYTVVLPGVDNGTIYKISPSGTNSIFYTFVPSSTQARSLAYYNGYIYYIDSDPSATYLSRKDMTGITDSIVNIAPPATAARSYLLAYNGFIYYTSNHAIYKISADLSSMPAPVPVLIAGLSGSPAYVDGAGTTARFNFPSGMVIANNMLYVADFTNNRIRVIDLATNFVSTFAGTGSTAVFNNPLDIAYDSVEGVFYVADFLNNQIKKIQNGIVTVFAGSTAGYVDGNIADAKISFPRGLFLIENNGTKPTIYVSEDKHIRLIEYV
jgi:DNA-binding beta-propeller fold protein YncE